MQKGGKTHKANKSFSVGGCRQGEGKEEPTRQRNVNIAFGGIGNRLRNPGSELE